MPSSTSAPVTFYVTSGAPPPPPPPPPSGTPVVEIAPGIPVNAAPAETDWIDITPRCRDLQWSTPTRNREFDLFNPGSGTAKLDNRDRALDPDYPPGPFYPNLLPLTWIRISRDNGAGLITHMFTGFIEGWPQTYWQDKDAWVTVRFLDAFALLARSRSMLSPWKMSVIGDRATWFWQLDDTTGVLAHERLNGKHGTYVGAQPNAQDLIVNDPGKGTLFANDRQFVELPPAAAMSGTVWSFEFWIKVPTPVNASAFWLWYLGDSGTGASSYALNIGSDGRLAFGPPIVPGGPARTMYMNAQPGAIHHVVITRNGAVYTGYVDGLVAGTLGAEATAIPNRQLHRIGRATNLPALDLTNTAVVQGAAIYDNLELTPAQVLMHYSAGKFGWDGQNTGTRVNLILDWCEIPQTLRSIDKGLSVLGPSTWTEGQAPLAYLQDITRTEHGALYVYPDGAIRFRDRTTMLTGSLMQTVQATFREKDGTNIPYTDLVLNRDWQEIFNRVEVTRVGGIMQVVEDKVSQDAHYGILTLSITNTLHRTDNEALALAQYLLGRRKDAKTRVTQLTVMYGSSPAGFAQLINQRLENRVAVKRTPQGIPPEISQDCWIEGFTHKVDAHNPKAWTVTVVLGDADTARTYFTLDVSTLDNAVLGF